jgi:hypothetical protein
MKAAAAEKEVRLNWPRNLQSCGAPGIGRGTKVDLESTAALAIAVRHCSANLTNKS